MSYGYYQGQEAQALDFYRKMLEVETDAAAREKLTELVDKLQKIVNARKTPPTSPSEVVQNAVAA